MNVKLTRSGCKRALTLNNCALKVSQMCAYITCILIIGLFSVINSNGVQSRDLPSFADQLNNITVAVGRDAAFQCVVHNLKKDFQVVWFHKDRHTLLAMENTVILRSGRISVSTHAGNTFNLYIHDIREEDSGEYMCQINTNPMISQSGFLQVVVPPRFTQKFTSSDEEVREDSSVSLRCSASGFPKPHIKWRREDGQPINIQPIQPNGTTKLSQKENAINGEYLNITKVTRLHMGAYICIANNSIPPAVSKRIFLGIKFSPLIWPPNQLIGSSVGSDVILICNLESHPKAITSWIRDSDRAIIHSNAKYSTSVESTDSEYRSEIRLKIIDLKASDFGTYTCLAKNTLGEVEASIKLFEAPKSSSEPKFAKEYKSKNKNTYQTMISVGFDDRGDGETNQNRAVVLTEVLNFEMTSEHITLQTEERVTVNSHNHRSETTDASIRFLPNIVVIVSFDILYIYFLFV